MIDNLAIKRIVERARQDDTLKAALQEARTAEDVVKAADEAGIAVSLEDLGACQERAGNGELSDAELENAAGGFLPYFERLSQNTGITVVPEHWRL